MRILYDSKQRRFKDPFGTLIPGQQCTLHLHIPASVQAKQVYCLIARDGQADPQRIPLTLWESQGAYQVFRGSFSLAQTGLYFYYFRIFNDHNSFRLMKQGRDTNMEAGDLWQVSCVPADYSVPQWAQGGTMYQIFPDRFCKAGEVDLTGKLQPYILHRDWQEEVIWQPDEQGEILNNDFFGGNFRGITEKMDYLAALGITVLYLNPISKSFSNHRYDTGDYKTPDPMLGTEADFTQMCRAAHDRGIKVILDGVYSHTGADSLYFDKNRSFGGQGAYCSPNSPYYSWYDFENWPETYKSWWGFQTLPNVNELDPGFVEYVITGEDSVTAHWLKAGADGFRLDVADELPDVFIAMLKKRIRQIRPDALLIGEVWEDASNKIAYDKRRRYFVDGELDSVMNYPFRTAILKFLRGEDGGEGLEETVMTLAENYPYPALLASMNLLGTHDTSRILTALVDDFDGDRAEKARRRLSPEQLTRAKEQLRMASFLQYTLPGTPSLYYGDEVGMEGYRDPFNRRTYPWGREDRELLKHFTRLGQLRREQEALRLGDVEFFQAGQQKLGFARRYQGKRLRIWINRSDASWEISGGRVLMGHRLENLARDGLTLAPMGFCVTEEV